MAAKFHRKDKNQDVIVDYLHTEGIKTWNLSQCGNGIPDIQIIVNKRLYAVEIKNPNTTYGKKGLNKPQALYARFAEDNLLVWNSVDDAKKFIENERKYIWVKKLISKVLGKV